MDELVLKLSQGDHPIEASIRPEKTAAVLKARIDLGYIHVRFTDTRGGTELGFKIDPATSDWSDADFERGKGLVRLSGPLKLNYVSVKCVAEIDLSTLTGAGHLEILEGSDAS